MPENLEDREGNCFIMTAMGILVQSTAVKGSRTIRIFLYCLLFVLSMLVFDPMTTLIGVLFALFALHFFSNRQLRRRRNSARFPFNGKGS